MREWPDVMTTKQAAEYLGVGEETVRGWLRTRRIPGRRTGAGWRIPKVKIDEWLQRWSAGTVVVGDKRIRAMIEVRSLALPQAPADARVFGAIRPADGEPIPIRLGEPLEFHFESDPRRLTATCGGRVGDEAIVFLGGWQDPVDRVAGILGGEPGGREVVEEAAGR